MQLEYATSSLVEAILTRLFYYGPFPVELVVREWIVGLSACLCIWIDFTMALFVFPALWKGDRWKPWVQTASAMMIFTAGVGLRAAWVWALLFSYTHNKVFAGVEDWWQIDVVAGILTAIGAVWKIRQFTPQQLRIMSGYKIEPGRSLSVLSCVTAVVAIALAHILL